MDLPRTKRLKQELFNMGLLYFLIIGMVLLVFLGTYVVKRCNFPEIIVTGVAETVPNPSTGYK